MTSGVMACLECAIRTRKQLRRVLRQHDGPSSETAVCPSTGEFLARGGLHYSRFGMAKRDEAPGVCQLNEAVRTLSGVERNRSY
ncbi:hypothetical protein HPB47_010200 [Ixodes persulcatus]|uniref:Uncharacterized protein n=1 Tax=Ixodes persulcatus TaxID=34615 RepID=A0AC60NZR6_IXOPE|nr:hypothetical protein HPB47_010200 [Ixodes persulcatus]